MTYEAYFTKFYFDEEKNNLKSRDVKIATKVTYKNCKEFRRYFWFLIKIMIGVLVSLSAITFPSYFAYPDDADNKIALIFCIAAFVLVPIIFVTAATHGLDFCLEDKNDFYKDHPDYIKLQEHNKIELEKRDKWRAEHPFEEKVRQALDSKNGNDVAEVIKMILEKEKSNG